MSNMLKKISVFLTLAMILSFVVACGQNGDQTTAPAGDGNGETTTAPADAEEINLEFFQQKRETADIITNIINGFQDVYPNIKIEQNNIPDAGTVLKTRVASNDTPDIFSHWFNSDSRLLIDEGYVRDLTDEPFMSKVDQQYLDFILYEGKNWMVPVSINFVGVFYNKEVFDEYGIEIPRTRQEFYDLCDMLVEAGEQPLMVTDREQWTIGHGGHVVMNNMFDTSEFLDVIHGDKSVRDISGFEDYVEWLEISRNNYVQADFLGTGYEAGLGDFANGNGVMLFQGNWIIPVLRSANPDFEFGVFVFPAETEAATKPHWGIDYTLCLNADPESEAIDEAALKFLDYFVNEGAQTWADQDGSISCIEGIESGLEAYQEVSDMIFAGNAYAGWFSDVWPAGAYDQFNIVQQTYLTTFDKDAFYDELDENFKAFAED